MKLVFNIDLDRPCGLCGDPGADKHNNTCLECVGKLMKQESARRILRIRERDEQCEELHS